MFKENLFFNKFTVPLSSLYSSYNSVVPNCSYLEFIRWCVCLRTIKCLRFQITFCLLFIFFVLFNFTFVPNIPDTLCICMHNDFIQTYPFFYSE